MKQELVKQVIKVGNTAGVLVPREWLDGKAKITLIDKPLDLIEIKKIVFEILDEYLKDIRAIILAGSYARNEQDSESDVEVIAVSEKISKEIKRGKFTIFVIPEKEIDEIINKNMMPLLPMILEGKSLLNEQLKDKLALKKINKRNIKWIVETTESALNIVNSFLEMDKDNKNEICDDSVAYSLVLRLRGLLIIKACKNGKILLNKELLTVIKKVTGSEDIYNQYRRLKNDKKSTTKASVSQACKLYEYTLGLLDEVKGYE